MTNRLQLDFDLQFLDERADFVRNYLQDPIFLDKKPTLAELDTISNYILWGKDRKTGLTLAQTKEIQLSSKSGDWDKTKKVESLDALLESPIFSENQLRGSTDPILKVTRHKLSRDHIKQSCPEYMRPIFEQLFDRIDQLDCKICVYELENGKRKEMRESLLTKFAPEQIEQFKEEVRQWSQLIYLKKRHELIEMRREQYALKDNFSTTIQNKADLSFRRKEDNFDFAAGIRIAPLGIKNDQIFSELIFRDFNKINPWEYTEEELKIISEGLWREEEEILTIDLTNVQHLYMILGEYKEMRDASLEKEVWDNNTKMLLDTVDYYIAQADLAPLQREILDYKLKKDKNFDICGRINKKWGKNYTPNYISTIFTQRIIPKIAAAAQQHYQRISNIFFEEEFKTCSCCGIVKLRTPEFFMRKQKSIDGLNPRCKECEKEKRNKKKIFVKGE